MKKFINYALALLLVPVLLISFNSCESEAANENLDLQDKVTIEYYEEYQTRPTGINYLDLVQNAEVEVEGDGEVSALGIGPTPRCPHEDCETAIPAMGAILQQMANDQCEEVWNCIVCCIDDNVVYALMYALPQSPPCAATSLPHVQ